MFIFVFVCLLIEHVGDDQTNKQNKTTTTTTMTKQNKTKTNDYDE